MHIPLVPLDIDFKDVRMVLSVENAYDVVTTIGRVQGLIHLCTLFL